MSPEDAASFVKQIRSAGNPLHVATDIWREAAIENLTREKESGVALVEIYLLRKITDIEEFAGIFAVDELGIWYYDGDGHINDNVWRQRVIQWRDIDQIVIHQIS